MVELNSPVWQTLFSAGNDADKWLRRLIEGNGDFRENMEILAEDLSHQLSYYSATAYVLPHLARLCPKLSLEDKVFMIAHMGAAIAAEQYESLVPGTGEYHEFQEGLYGLRSETTALVTSSDIAPLLENNPEFGQMFALSALAIIGSRKHSYHLFWMSGSCWEEAGLACSCGWNDETFPLTGNPDCLKPVHIAIWDGKFLGDEPVWFNGLLQLSGDDEISPILPLVYGTGICPECGKQETFWQWFDRFCEGY